MAISVLVTVGNAADELLPKVNERLNNVKTAPGMEEGAEMGPLVTEAHRDRVVGLIDSGVEGPTVLVVGGSGER